MKRTVTLLLSVLLLAGTLGLFGVSTSAVAVGQTFRFQVGADDWGSGKNPIQDGLWEFEWFDEDTDAFGQMRWSAADSHFEAPFTTASASDVHWYCRNRYTGNSMHPGARADAVRTFLCPEAGKVEYTLTAARDAVVSGANNGNSFRVFLNQTLVWPADSTDGYLTVTDKNDVTVKVVLDVKKGDKIRFMVGSLGNSASDGVTVTANAVTYLEGENLTPPENGEAEKTVRIACVGDSITAGYLLSNPAAESFPGRLAEILGEDYKVLNFGNSAKTLLSDGNDPYINTATYRSALASEPDIVIIELGSNDGKAVNWQNGARKESFRKDYLALIEAFRNLPTQPVVYVCTSPYVRPNASTTISADTIRNDIVPLEREIAQEAGCEVLDLFKLTQGLTAAEFNADGLHPSAAGAQKIARYIADFLQNEPETPDPTDGTDGAETDGSSDTASSDTASSDTADGASPWIFASAAVLAALLVAVAVTVLLLRRRSSANK